MNFIFAIVLSKADKKMKNRRFYKVDCDGQYWSIGSTSFTTKSRKLLRLTWWVPDLNHESYGHSNAC